MIAAFFFLFRCGGQAPETDRTSERVVLELVGILRSVYGLRNKSESTPYQALVGRALAQYL